MEKFNNKYRIPSARLQTWDYGNNGLYFITICTKNRENYFGKITEGEMMLSEIGFLANKYWHEIPEHFPFMKLNEFVVMPNHVHGIIIIDKPDNDGGDGGRDGGGDDGGDGDGRDGGGRDGDDRDGDGRDGRDAINRVSTNTETDTNTESDTDTKKTGGITGKNNPMFHENISRIIRWYKGRCAFEIRKIHADFAWQPRFHDHIIRNQETYEKIKNYIINNPQKWNEDTFNKYNK